jgi:hypothetical protein
LLAKWRERLAEQSFICERPANFRGIEERDTSMNRRMKQPRHLFHILRRPVRKTHPHAAKAEGRNFQVALSECAILYG